MLKDTKGYEHSRGKLIRNAEDTYWKAGAYAYAGRRKRKHDMRKTWISRINAALAPFGMKYSVFMNKLKDAKIELNRKALAELSVRKPEVFKFIVQEAKK